MKNVYLFQPNDKLDFKSDVYPFPYSVGILWSYVSTQPGIKEHFTPADFIFYKEPFEDALGKIIDPDVCAFSCYIWNANYCIELARRIKELYPNCLVVFGGPHVDETFSQTNSAFDAFVIGQGEIAFASILTKRMNGESIPKITHGTALSDLSLIPSPYTTGLFDRLISENPNYYWGMTTETLRGCPYACTFCNWGSMVGNKIKTYDETNIHHELDWSLDKPIYVLMLADANFGLLKERDTRIARYMAETADNPRSNIASIFMFAATKNSPDTIIELSVILRKYISWVYASRQSTNELTLRSIKRFNLKVNDTQYLLKLAYEHGLPTTTEFILGLPDETLETWKEGLCQTIADGQHCDMSVYPAIVLPNTEFSTPEYLSKYNIESVKYVNTAVKPIPEEIDLVNRTNTMTTVEIAEAMHYSILVLAGHMSKLSQYQARYCYDQYHISYRQFYDRLNDILLECDKPIGVLYRTGLEELKEWYSTGLYMHNEDDVFPNSVIQDTLMKKLFSQLDDFIDCVNQTVSSFGIELTANLIAFFNNLFYNPKSNYPVTISEIPFDIDEHLLTNKSTSYKIYANDKVDPRDGTLGSALVSMTPNVKKTFMNRIEKL